MFRRPAMDGHRHGPARILLGTAGALLLAAGLMACGGGGGSDSGDTLTLDPARADVLSHASLISERDLPGLGWTVTGTDEFSEDGLGTGDADTAACKSLDAKLAKARSEAEASRAGRAQKEFAKQAAAIPTSVEVQVAVFKDTKVPAKVQDIYKDALGGGDFSNCFKDTIEASIGEDLPGGKVKISAASPALSAPLGGVAKAFKMEVSAAGLNLDLRIQMYLWRYGNAGVTVLILGPSDEVTRALVEAVVAKTQAGLEREAKRP